jgi:N-acetylglucosamine kinase-like BadF-type ATPase
VAAGTALDPEILYQRVMQRLELTLEDVVRSAIRQAIEDHMGALAPQIQRNVDQELRRMIADAVAAERQAPGAGR